MKRTTLSTAASLVVAGLALAGCASSDDKPPNSQVAASSRQSAALQPQTTTRTTPIPSAAPAVRPGFVVAAESSTCQSSTTNEPLDLSSATVEIGVPGHAGDAAKVTWNYSGQVPNTGTVLWSVSAVGIEGGDRVEFGYKTLDGAQIALYAFFGGKQLNLQSPVDLTTPGSISAVMPSSAVDALGSQWQWQAHVNVDGEDVDACPS